jgi:hypothetical protein
MKLFNCFWLILLLHSDFVVGQIGIGTKMPDESSALDIVSKSKGVLIPRMSSEERDLIQNPANALLLYNTTLQAIEVNIGTKSNPDWVLVGNYGVGVQPLPNTLASGAIFVGTNGGIAKGVLVSGEALLSHSGWITLDNTAVISKTLIGYQSGAGKITPEDSILQAIQKLEGNQITNPIQTITDNYTILLTDGTLLCDTETRSFTINLPEASSCPGKIYSIHKIDDTSNELIINPPVQLNKKSTVSQLNFPKSFKIQSDGTKWQAIN